MDVNPDGKHGPDVRSVGELDELADHGGLAGLCGVSRSGAGRHHRLAQSAPAGLWGRCRR